jgi:hypothetical protein
MNSTDAVEPTAYVDVKCSISAVVASSMEWPCQVALKDISDFSDIIAGESMRFYDGEKTQSSVDSEHDSWILKPVALDVTDRKPIDGKTNTEKPQASKRSIFAEALNTLKALGGDTNNAKNEPRGTVKSKDHIFKRVQEVSVGDVFQNTKYAMNSEYLSVSFHLDIKSMTTIRFYCNTKDVCPRDSAILKELNGCWSSDVSTGLSALTFAYDSITKLIPVSESTLLICLEMRSMAFSHETNVSMLNSLGSAPSNSSAISVLIGPCPAWSLKKALQSRRKHCNMYRDYVALYADCLTGPADPPRVDCEEGELCIGVQTSSNNPTAFSEFEQKARTQVKTLVTTMHSLYRRIRRQLTLHEKTRVYQSNPLRKATTGIIQSPELSSDIEKVSRLVETQFIRERNIASMTTGYCHLKILLLTFFNFLRSCSRIAISHGTSLLRPRPQNSINVRFVSMLVEAFLNSVDVESNKDCTAKEDPTPRDIYKDTSYGAVPRGGSAGDVRRSGKLAAINQMSSSNWSDALNGAEGNLLQLNESLTSIQLEFIAFEKLVYHMVMYNLEQCIPILPFDRSDIKTGVSAASTSIPSGSVSERHSHQLSSMAAALQIAINRFHTRTIQGIRRWFSHYNFGIRRGQAKKLLLLRFCIEHNRRYETILSCLVGSALSARTLPIPTLDKVFPISQYLVVLSSALGAEIDCYLARTIVADYDGIAMPLSLHKLLRLQERENNISLAVENTSLRDEMSSGHQSTNFPLIRAIAKGGNYISHKVAARIGHVKNSGILSDASRPLQKFRKTSKFLSHQILFRSGTVGINSTEVDTMSFPSADSSGTASRVTPSSSASAVLSFPWSVSYSIEGYAVGPIPEIAYGLMDAYSASIEPPPSNFPDKIGAVSDSSIVFGVDIGSPHRSVQKGDISRQKLLKLPCCMNSADVAAWSRINLIIIKSIIRYYENLASEYNYIMTTLYDTYMKIFPSAIPNSTSNDELKVSNTVRHRLNSLGRFPILSKLRRRIFDTSSEARTNVAQGSNYSDTGNSAHDKANGADLELIDQMQQYSMELCNFLCSLGNDAYRIGTDHLDALKTKLRSNFGVHLPEVGLICDLCENISQLWLEVAIRAAYYVAMLISDDVRDQVSTILSTSLSNVGSDSSNEIGPNHKESDDQNESVVHFISEEFPVIKAILVDYLFVKCSLYCKQICA